MNSIKQLVIGIILVCFLFKKTVVAQENFVPGFYKNNRQDTIKGYINLREWLKNPSFFEFKKELSDTKSELVKVNEASYFEASSEVYERFCISISMTEFILSNSASKATVKNDTVWLEVLQKGHTTTLYRYKDNIKVRYYLQYDGHVTELENEVEDTENGLRIREKYKEQLYRIALQKGKLNPDFELQLKRTSYTRKPLMDIMTQIDGKIVNSVKSQVVNESVSSVQLYLGSGINESNIHYSGGTQWDKSSSPSFNPFFTLGFRYMPNRRVGKISLCTELSINQSNFHTVANNLTSSVPQRIDYTFDQFATNIGALINYYFLPKKNFTAFCGLGFRLTLSSYKNNFYTITTTYPTGKEVFVHPDFFELNRSYFSLICRGGVRLFDRIEFFGEYNPSLSAQINLNYDLWTEIMVSTRLGISYYLHL